MYLIDRVELDLNLGSPDAEAAHQEVQILEYLKILSLEWGL